jgi:hypothetical protein
MKFTSSLFNQGYQRVKQHPHLPHRAPKVSIPTLIVNAPMPHINRSSG